MTLVFAFTLFIGAIGEGGERGSGAFGPLTGGCPNGSQQRRVVGKDLSLWASPVVALSGIYLADEDGPFSVISNSVPSWTQFVFDYDGVGDAWIKGKLKGEPFEGRGKLRYSLLEPITIGFLADNFGLVYIPFDTLEPGLYEMKISIKKGTAKAVGKAQLRFAVVD
jgi:hypothetical protein